MTTPYVGQRVQYWVRRQGEAARLQTGVLIQVSGHWTRVRLDGNHPVPVQSVELKRLSLIDENV